MLTDQLKIRRRIWVCDSPWPEILFLLDFSFLILVFLMTWQYEHLLIFGVGLLGGSVALAAKQRGLVRTVSGFDHRSEVLQAAQKLGIIDDVIAPRELRTALQHSNIGQNTPALAIFCVPVHLIPEQVQFLSQRCPPDVFPMLNMTDVGSTKRNIDATVTDTRFLGSHPIAGSEKSGCSHADSRLFENRLVILTPRSETPTDLRLRLHTFWQGLGARTQEMPASEHDAVLAVTSHLPHLISVALNALPCQAERMCAGTGFESITRLAAGHPDLWAAILHENADNVLAALARFQGHLSDITQLLKNQDCDALRQILSEQSINM